MLPFTVAATYLVLNFALVVWIAREETSGRAPSPSLVGIGRVIRYLPPLFGLVYLVTIAGDWPFFLFVVVFFTVALALLNGLLSIPSRPRGK
jgi:hypothetical protein